MKILLLISILLILGVFACSKCETYAVTKDHSTAKLAVGHFTDTLQINKLKRTWDFAYYNADSIVLTIRSGDTTWEVTMDSLQYSSNALEIGVAACK